MDLIKEIIKLIESLLGKRRKLSDFLTVGFHGDRYLGELALSCILQAEQFIETGTNVGSSLLYVLQHFPNLDAYSCEPDKEAYNFALTKVKKFKNVKLFNQLSTDMLHNISRFDTSVLEKDTVFWLDAHGYGYQWDLKEEINFITQHFRKGYIFIDDFQVPGLDCFKYDEYDGQICCFDFIKDSFKQGLKFSLYYPAYTEKTSEYHPLIGWGLIDFGHKNELKIPHDLKEKIHKAL